MEVTEVATRLLRRYWPVLLLSVLLPVLAMAAWTLHQPRTYTAHARIVAAESIPRAQAEAAAVVSQVQALATSRNVIAAALTAAHLPREADRVISAVTVTGLGSSALVDIGYTDREPAMAARVTGVVANAVATELDAVRIGGLPEVLKDVDNQLTDLATKRAPIAAAAQANPKDPVAQNKLAGIDRLISDLSGDRDRLAEEAAAAGRSTVVATPVRPAHADPRGLPARLAIAGLLGLVLALLVVGVNETLRPAVSSASRVARLLEVPVLGTVSPDPVELADIGRRIRLAARRSGVSTVVLARPARSTPAPELVDRIGVATLRPDAAPHQVAVPLDVDEAAALARSATSVPAEASFTAGTAAGNGADGHDGGSVAVLTAAGPGGRADRPVRVCALQDLDPGAEGDRIGLVLLAGGNTRLHAVDGVRDLMAATGWPLLGVLGDVQAPQGGRR